MYDFIYTQGCYVEVVFKFIAKVPSQSCFSAFLILISLHALSFFKCVHNYNGDIQHSKTCDK